MTEKASIGQTLRQHREERGLTPEQAAYQSKVPLRLLQALEEDDYHLLPDAAYLIRFLHDYARLLKLSPDVLEKEFRQNIHRPPVHTLTPTSPPPPPIPWKQVAWTGVAILVVTPLVFIALSLASKRPANRAPAPPVAERPAEESGPIEGGGPVIPDRLPASQPDVSRPEPASAPAGIREIAPAPAGIAQSPPTLPSEARSRRFLLMAHALELTWMVVRADAGQEREVLLQKGQTARFSADAGFVVTIGNAGGVELTLNGEPVPSLGASGQVIRDLSLPSPRRPSGATGEPSPERVLAPPER
ncbi:MAG TPA: RodZ domain-containing protein [Candidatus Methylomirabilis sp.]|nr:RodZ domain-containing protein [Candidatus Methylomirabilis sp.]